jgi:hypothetical protein
MARRSHRDEQDILEADLVPHRHQPVCSLRDEPAKCIKVSGWVRLMGASMSNFGR